jgi:plastocyanin
MRSEFRERVLLPIVMPLGVLTTIAAIAWSLSRILLTVPELVSVILALGVASYVLVVAALVAAWPQISSRALFIGLSLGLLALIGAGVTAHAAGPRPFHEEEGSGGPAVEGAEQVAPSNTFVAIDIAFEAAPTAVPAGPVELTLVNKGAAIHNVTIGQLGEVPILEAGAGETIKALVTLAPGVYNYYCNVPGHEELMNGQLTVA